MAADWYPGAEKFETPKFFAENLPLRAVVIHIAEASYNVTVQWLQDAELNPNSSAHFVVAKEGRVAQLVSVNDGAWANGLRWNEEESQPNSGYWTNRRGVRVNPSWQDIVPGANPNLYTISIEHEGFYQEAWTPQMYAANNDLLVWIAEQYDLWWVPFRNLIGHYAIDNIDRPNCPGPTVNFQKMAADANTTRLLKMVVPKAAKKHIYGTTALLSLPTRTIITQLSDADVDVYGYLDFSGARWYITPYSFNTKQPNFFLAAATERTPELFPSLALDPGFRDAVTPTTSELCDLKPQWVRVLLFAQYQNFETGQNSELDWLIQRINDAGTNTKILALLNVETLNEMPPATGSADWITYTSKAANLAHQIAQFYRGKIHALQLWNEPDVQQILPENYAALLSAAHTQIKAVNPALPVISAGICCGESYEYLQRVVNAAPTAFEGVGWHIYAERADGFPFSGWGFGEIRNSINNARAIAGKPLWITEFGARLNYNWGSLAPESAVAEYMKRAYAIINQVGRHQVEQTFWYTWRDPENIWSLVDDANHKRAAWYTFQQLAQSAQPPAETVEITNVILTPTTLDVGQMLNVSITVRNGTNATLSTQAPSPNFVYNEGETFLSRGYAEANGAYRVGIDFDGRSGVDHPYRWGLGSALAPNETRTINGQIRLNTIASKSYWAGLVQERVAWKQDNAGKTLINVTQTAPPPPTGNPTIIAVSFTPPRLASGQLLHVSITVRNDTNVPLPTQGPNPGFTYLEGESFLSHGFSEQREAFRVGVDFENRTPTLIDHPYRWGFGSALNPGETRVINGAVRLNTAGTREYWAGLVREQVEWFQDKEGSTAIVVSSGAPPTPPLGKPTITNVQFSPTALEQGQIVQVKVTVRNDSSQTLLTQEPNIGYLYNEGDNFFTKGFPPTNGMWRIAVDYEGRANTDPTWYPYRWGLGGALAPGQSAVVVGFIRLNRRQTAKYWAGLIQEETNVIVDAVGATAIDVAKS